MKIYLNKNKKLIIFLAVSFLGVFFGGPNIAQAGFWSAANLIVGGPLGIAFSILVWILYIPIYFFGTMVSSLLLPLMVWVANYNNFIYQPGVSDGWIIVRDVANMFVVVGMLLIAVGTLFGIENYNYKKLLPKLIMAAIMINFSKMIIGLMIDVSQVITLTFVKEFSKVAAGNIVNSTGLGKILDLSASPLTTAAGGVTGVISLAASLLLGIIMLVVLCAIFWVLIAYFIGRIIVLWIAIVLSPLLFIMPALPAVDKFSSKVWDTVIKNLISGPVLAFFLWLSFAIMQKTVGGRGMAAQFNDVSIGGTDKFNLFFSKFGTIDTILNFILVIGLLMTSLMMASQMGAAGSKMAGNLAGKLQEGGKKMLKNSAVGLGRALDRTSLRIQEKRGVPANRRISLRPSVIKEALKEAKAAKEERIYGDVTAGMAARFAADKDSKKMKEGFVNSQRSEQYKKYDELPGSDSVEMLAADYQKLMKDGIRGNEGKAQAILMRAFKNREGEALARALGFENLSPENLGKFIDKQMEGADDNDKNKALHMIKSVAVQSGDYQYAGATKIVPDGKGERKIEVVKEEDVPQGALAAQKEMTSEQRTRSYRQSTFATADGALHKTGEQILDENHTEIAETIRSKPGKIRKEVIDWIVDQQEKLTSAGYGDMVEAAIKHTGAGLDISDSDKERIVKLEQEIPDKKDRLGRTPELDLRSGLSEEIVRDEQELQGLYERRDSILSGKRPSLARNRIDRNLDSTSFQGSEAEVERVADDFGKYMEETIAELKNNKINFSDLFQSGGEFSAKIEGLGQVLKDDSQRKKIFDFASGPKLQEIGNIKDPRAQQLFLRSMINLTTAMKEASKRRSVSSSTAGESSDTGNSDEDDDEEERI